MRKVVYQGDVYMLNSNKLRLDLESRISDKVEVGANFNSISYHGKKSFNMIDYLPDAVTVSVSTSMRPYYDFNFTDDMYVDNAYVRIAFKRLDLAVGKQQISLGTGYVWNPIDVYNSKDFLDPTYEQPGRNAIRLDVPFSNSYGAVFLLEPEDTFEKSGKLMRFKGKAGHFDFSLTSIEKQWTTTDFSTFIPAVQKRMLTGLDFAGEFIGVGVWGEVAYNDLVGGGNYSEGVIGLDHTLESGTYLMLELYHNTAGKDNYTQYDLNDWMSWISGETKSICRNQAYMMISHPVAELVELGCSVIGSPDDKSMGVIPMLSYNMFENVDLTAYLNSYSGEKGSVYSSNLGNGGMVRIRAYF
jgi:hypothetical protein